MQQPVAHRGFMNIPRLWIRHAVEIISAYRLFIFSRTCLLCYPPREFRNSDVPVLAKLTDAYVLWHRTMPTIPKTARYSLAMKIDAQFTDLIELLLRAAYSPAEQKTPLLKQASVKLDAIKFFLQVAWSIKALDNKTLASLSQPLSEVGKMIGGWLSHLTKDAPMKEAS